jgi:hypothetical protein
MLEACPFSDRRRSAVADATNQMTMVMRNAATKALLLAIPSNDLCICMIFRLWLKKEKRIDIPLHKL